MVSPPQEVFRRHQHCPVLFKTLHILAAFLSCPTATIATGYSSSISSSKTSLRSSPHISSNRVTYRPRQMSNPPTNSDSDYQELEVEHYRTVQTNRSRNSNQMPYYDINEFKPLYSNRPIYSEIPSSVSWKKQNFFWTSLSRAIITEVFSFTHFLITFHKNI